jgi:hypothetical protein
MYFVYTKFGPAFDFKVRDKSQFYLVEVFLLRINMHLVFFSEINLSKEDLKIGLFW